MLRRAISPRPEGVYLFLNATLFLRSRHSSLIDIHFRIGGQLSGPAFSKATIPRAEVVSACGTWITILRVRQPGVRQLPREEGEVLVV